MLIKRKLSNLRNHAVLYPPFQKVLGRLHADLPDPKAWVFIVGCYNSGTTLLSELLRLSPKVRSLPWEGVALTHHMKRCDDFGMPRMWWKVEDRIRDAEKSLGAREAGEIRRQWAFSASPSDDRPVFVEKSITNSMRIPFLDTHFSPALFIHIIRDPVAAAEGIRRKARPSAPGSPPYSIEDCARMWTRSEEVTSLDLHGRRVVEMRYEDLCTAPMREIGRVEVALESISSAIGSLEISIPESGPKVHGRTMRIENQDQGSYDRLETREIELIQRITQEFAPQGTRR